MPHFTHLTLLWGATVGLLLVFMMLWFVQRFRHETGRGHWLEWEDDNCIHYDEDDDEL